MLRLSQILCMPVAEESWGTPLQPRRDADHGHKTFQQKSSVLVQVVKADLAGWLGNPGRRARSFLWPLVFATSGSFLSRVVRGAVVLREQARLVDIITHAVTEPMLQGRAARCIWLYSPPPGQCAC